MKRLAICVFTRSIRHTVETTGTIQLFNTCQVDWSPVLNLLIGWQMGILFHPFSQIVEVIGHGGRGVPLAQGELILRWKGQCGQEQHIAGNKAACRRTLPDVLLLLLLLLRMCVCFYIT